MKFGDIVEVDWDDHTFVFNTYGGQGITKMTTCGYFVLQNDRTFIVALTMQEGREPADVQIIDRRMLTKVRKVR